MSKEENCLHLTKTEFHFRNQFVLTTDLQIASVYRNTSVSQDGAFVVSPSYGGRRVTRRLTLQLHILVESDGDIAWGLGYNGGRVDAGRTCNTEYRRF